MALLTADYFSVPEEEVKGIESVLTVVGGRVVYGAQEFSKLNPELPPVSPDWSPVKHHGGYHHAPAPAMTAHACSHHSEGGLLPEGLFCPCFAF